MTSPFSAPVHRRRRPTQARLRHDLAQAVSTMAAVVDVIGSDPLHAAAVLPRLEQLRVQADWMATILREQVGPPRPCDVGDAVAEAWTAAGRHALCTVQLRREPVPLALVDATALRRALRNLLDNAIRAAGSTGRVEISVSRGGRGIVVDVSDDGPGFGKVAAQSGLGLATVSDFARRAGGDLSHGVSHLGGTLMRLEIPPLEVRSLVKSETSA